MKKSKTLKSLKYVLKIVLTFGILAVILYGFQKKLGSQENLLSEILANIKSINYGYLILAIFLFILASLLAALRVALLAWSHNINISYLKLLKNMYIGYLFNPLLMGATGGDIIRSYYLTKQTHKKTEIVTVLFLDRFLGILVLGLVASIVLLLNFHDPKLKSIFYGVMGIYSMLIIIAVLSSSRRIMKKLSFIGKLFENTKIHDIGKKAINTLHETKKYKKTLILAAFCTFIFQALVYISAWTASKAIPHIDPLPLKYFFLFLPIIFTISALPISLGGIGVGEAAYAALFTIVGASESYSITIALLNRFILIFISLIGGIVYVLPSTEKIDLDEAMESKDSL